MITLFSVLPALIYALVVYLSTPINTIKLNQSTKYVFGGILSTVVVLSIHFLFPILHAPTFIKTGTIVDTPIGLFYEPTIMTNFIRAFCQTALIEELSKFLLFWLIFKYLSKDDTINSMSIVFNCMLIGVGFAVQENMLYALRSESAIDVLLVRSFSAVLLHMVVGILMGYFIALGRKNTIYTKDISEFRMWMRLNPKYRRVIYTTFGIIAAATMHGVYDFNIFIDLEYQIPIIIICLTIAYLLFKNLKSKEFKKLNRSASSKDVTI